LFDYVVVGAGPSAAGFVYGILEQCIVEGREELPFSIAILERGGVDHDAKTLLPRRWHDAANTESSSVSLLQTSIGNRVVDVPTGKGLGGTTNVNACLVVPPADDDFQSWPLPWRESVIPAIHKIQDALINHGTVYQFNTTANSLLTIDTADRSQGFWRRSVFPSFVTCIPMTVERNSKGHYKRINYFDALVAPVLKEHPQLAKQITWLCNTQVQRLLLDGRKITGVECESATRSRFQVKARTEVILSAGALETPALLLVSGIGLEGDLAEAGIPSQGLNLPVGYNLKDHILLPRLFLHSFKSYELSPTTVQAFYNLKDGENRFQVMLTDSACYPALAAQGVASILRRRVNYSPRWVSDTVNKVLYVVFRMTRILVRFTIDYSPLFYFLKHFCFIAVIAFMNPNSSGRVRVSRRNHASPECRRTDVSVDITDVYLACAEDIDSYVSAWPLIGQFCSNWFDQCMDLVPGTIFPIYQKDTFTLFARETCQPYYHWCGSCAIGSVVDDALRVQGIKGLRVCDASVMPSLPSAPTTLTCAGLGYNLALDIARCYPRQRTNKRTQ
jgi:choline dehydrogenase